MPSLIDTNPYLRDPEKRFEMLAENAHASSVMEGAKRLPLLKGYTEEDLRRSIASRKKRAKKSYSPK